MKILKRTESELIVGSTPPAAIYVSSLAVFLVGLAVAWYFGGGWLFYILEIIVSLYLASTVLEDAEEIVFSTQDDSVAIIKISPILRSKSVVKGKLSEIVSIRLDEQISQMWGKMSRISLLFESGLRLPLTLGFSTDPLDDIVTAIDLFLEETAPLMADELYGEGDDEDEEEKEAPKAEGKAEGNQKKKNKEQKKIK